MITMTDIVRTRYQTGAYGGTHFRLAAATQDQIRATTPSTTPRPAWMPAPDLMSQYLSIPIVLDETVPVGHWRLVDDADPETVVAEGTLDTARKPEFSPVNTVMTFARNSKGEAYIVHDPKCPQGCCS